LIADTLKRAEVFLGLDDSDLEMVVGLPSTHYEVYQPGEVLFGANTEAKYLYVLEEGLVDIVVDIPPGSQEKTTQVRVDIVTKGDLFGWSALVKPNSYVLAGVCQKPSKVILISGEELISLCDRNQHIGYKIFRGLSQIIGSRFRDLEQVLIIGRRFPFVVKFSGT
jgi:CRP-like cAMP-binding protein